MAGTNLWFILALAVGAFLILKKSTLLSRPGSFNRSPASPPSTAKPDPTSLDDIDPDVLGLAYANAMKRRAENKVVKGIMDTAGKTIEEAFTAPFSAADPGKNKPEDIPF